MEKLKKMQCITYTGTVESYNKLIDDLKLDEPKNNYYQWVKFLDENHDTTNKFTGIFMTMDGLIRRPGDVYHIEIEE